MEAKIGFDYGLFDTETFDNTAETEDFDAALASENVTALTRLVYDGDVYDDRIISTPTISRMANGIAGNADVELDNSDGIWNYLLDTYRYYTNLGRTCRVGLYFPDIDATLYLYTGTVEGVSFIDTSVILHLQDKMANALDKQIGTGQEPELEFCYFTPPEYELAYGRWYTPGQMIWKVLTKYAGLNGDLYTSANPDINWDSYDAWRTATEGMDYRLQGRFSGQKISGILQRIADMTNSVFWVDGEGKINFALIEPDDAEDVAEFDASNSVSMQFDLSKQDITNTCTVYHGYDVPSNTWGGVTTKAMSTIDPFVGIHEYVDEDKIVWHFDSGSAMAFGNAFIARNEYPRSKLRLKTSLVGFLRDIGERISVTSTIPPEIWAPRSYWIEEIPSIDMDSLTIEFLARRGAWGL